MRNRTIGGDAAVMYEQLTLPFDEEEKEHGNTEEQHPVD